MGFTFVQIASEIFLDKVGGVWYNRISRPVDCGRRAKNVNGKIAQKMGSQFVNPSGFYFVLSLRLVEHLDFNSRARTIPFYCGLVVIGNLAIFSVSVKLISHHLSIPLS
jgi:hypothetical protein